MLWLCTFNGHFTTVFLDYATGRTWTRRYRIISFYWFFHWTARLLDFFIFSSVDRQHCRPCTAVFYQHAHYPIWPILSFRGNGFCITATTTAHAFFWQLRSSG